MRLEELPGDVLYLLVEHLRSVSDYRSLLLTCRAVENVLQRPSSRVLAILASRPASKAYRPFPLTAIALKGRILANWAAREAQNGQVLVHALSSGPSALAALAFSISPLTTADLAAIRRTTEQTLFPTVRYLRTLPDMANCRETIGPTIIPRPFSSIQKVLMYCISAYWAYCELFHLDLSHSFSSFIPTAHPHPEPDPLQRPLLGPAARSAWMSSFVAVEPEYKPKCTCECHPQHEREMAQEVNQVRAKLHQCSCLMLALTFQRCVLVVADEVLSRLEDAPPDPQLDRLEWPELYDASGALRSLGLTTLNWLIATKPPRSGPAQWPHEITRTLVAASKAGVKLDELRLLEDDLQERATSLLHPGLSD